MTALEKATSQSSGSQAAGKRRNTLDEAQRSLVLINQLPEKLKRSKTYQKVESSQPDMLIEENEKTEETIESGCEEVKVEDGFFEYEE